MSHALATWLVRIAGLYLVAGMLFAIPFVGWGVARVDPAAREGTIGFRLLIVPGVVALWPVLLRRWLAGVGAPPAERNAHRDRAAPPAAS